MRAVRRTEPNVVERLRALDACAVSDALDSLGLLGAVTGIVPLWPAGRVAGLVRTLALRPAHPGEPRPAAHLGARAVDSSAPGDVIVVANGARGDSAAWGGLLSAAAHRRGVAGVVVDGLCRDVDEAADLGFPVFARAATPVSARGRAVEEATAVTVTVGGVAVAPGDLVIADRSGVVFVEAAEADRVLAAAETIAAKERAMLADLSAGATVASVLDHRYESMLDDGGGAGAVH